MLPLRSTTLLVEPLWMCFIWWVKNIPHTGQINDQWWPGVPSWPSQDRSSGCQTHVRAQKTPFLPPLSYVLDFHPGNTSKMAASPFLSEMIKDKIQDQTCESAPWIDLSSNQPRVFSVFLCKQEDCMKYAGSLDLLASCHKFLLLWWFAGASQNFPS